MKTIPLVAFFVFFVSACTTTTVTKSTPEGKEIFRATNTSIGWDRENVSLDLLKSKDETAVQIGIGKSGGSKGLDAAIKVMGEALETLKALRP